MEQPDDEQKKPHASKLLLRRRRLQQMTAMRATAVQVLREQRLDEMIESFASDDVCDDPNFFYGSVETSPPCAQWVVDAGIPQRDFSVRLQLKHPILQAIHKQYKIFSAERALNWIRRFDPYESQDNWNAVCRTIGVHQDAKGSYVVYWLSAYLEILDGVAESWIEEPEININPTDMVLLRRYGREIYRPSWSIHALSEETIQCATVETEDEEAPCDPDGEDETSPVDTDVDDDDFSNVPRMP